MGADLLLVSLGTTRGLRLADARLVGLLEAAGRLRGESLTVRAIGVRIGAGDRLRRGYPVNDLVEAAAARRATAAAVARERPRAVIFSTTTAALLADLPAGLPYAIWCDSPARLNRPGARNALLHLLERRRMRDAAMVMVLSPPAAEALPAGARRVAVIPAPIRIPEAVSAERERTVVAYTPDPKAKDLELLVRAWAAYLALEGDPRMATGASGARLVLCGIEPEWAAEFLRRRGIDALPPRLERHGMLSAAAFSTLLSRAAVFVSAARWEDFGIAPLEALGAGAALVAAPGGGPFPALALARELEPTFVATDRSPAALARALAAALSAPDPRLRDYRSAARAALEVYGQSATVERLAAQVLPALLGR